MVKIVDPVPQYQLDAKDPTGLPCISCGSSVLQHIEKDWDRENYKIYCKRCGYFRFNEQGLIIHEGYAVPVQCKHCYRCQSWIRVPVYVKDQDNEVYRLVSWTCDNPRCQRSQSVYESMIKLDDVWNLGV